MAVQKKKKTVSFSINETLRRVTFDDEESAATPGSCSKLHDYNPWLTEGEVASMKKRAKNLAALHYLKTRPGEKAPSIKTGIVYNCHPAHYEIIGESLRGMEHITDTFKAHSRKRLRSGVISLIEERQKEQNTSSGNRLLACKYEECTNEAMAYSIQIADEDAQLAAAILEEDLKQEDGDAFSKSSQRNHCSITDVADYPMSSTPVAA